MAAIDDNGRPEPPLAAGEVATLRGFLDFQRATLEWKTRGLEDEALRRRLAPSAMTLGGLLHHLAYVEDYWFSEVAGARPHGEPWASVDWAAEPDWDWTVAAELGGAVVRQRWTASVAASERLLDALLDAAPDALAGTHPAWGGRAEVSLRWILVHMIEEYARHNGHADLLREAIDGQTGE